MAGYYLTGQSPQRAVELMEEEAEEDKKEKEEEEECDKQVMYLITVG